jgi:hypothetical protein
MHSVKNLPNVQQKRPTIEAKETYYRSKRDLLNAGLSHSDKRPPGEAAMPVSTSA